MSTVEEPSSATLPLGTSLCLEKLEPVHAEMLRHAQAPKMVSIDASSVVDIDSAGLQLLACFVDTLRGAGGTVTWRGVSESVRCWSDVTGLSNALGLPDAAARTE